MKLLPRILNAILSKSYIVFTLLLSVPFVNYSQYKETYTLTKPNKAPEIKLNIFIKKDPGVDEYYKLIIKKIKDAYIDSVNKANGNNDIDLDLSMGLYIAADDLDYTYYNSFHSSSYNYWLYSDNGISLPLPVRKLNFNFYIKKSHLGYEKYYLPIQIDISSIHYEYSQTFQLKHSTTWRIVSKSWVPGLNDWQDLDRAYNLQAYYLNTKTGKIIKGSKLLRRCRLKTLFEQANSFVVIYNSKLYYNTLLKKQLTGMDLVKMQKININDYDVNVFKNED